MSSAPLYPESKTENAIYVAFGTTLGLGFMRWYTPDIFSDIVSAMAIALFLGSLVGSTLFYIKLERIVDWVVRRWIMRRYGDEICHFLVSSHLAIETWRMRVTGKWESVESKSKTMLLRVTEGPDVHNEMWSLRGAFYFSLAIPIIIFVAGIQLEVLILVSLTLLFVVMGSVRINHRNFMLRCSRIVMFRLIQELYSVFKARDPGDRPQQNWFIGDSSSKDSPPIELVLEELEQLLEKHDWNGFLTRFLFLEEEIYQWLERNVQNLEPFYIEQWSSILAEESFDKKLHLVSQIMYFRGIVKSLISYRLLGTLANITTKRFEILMQPDGSALPLDSNLFFSTIDDLGIEENFGSSIRRAFSESAKTDYNPKTIEIVLKWMKDGKIRDLESVLIKSCEKMNDPHIESVIIALKRYGENVQWQNIGPRFAKRLVGIRKQISDKIFIRALESQNGDSILALMKIFDFAIRDICNAFVQLAKHSDARVRRQNIQNFLNEDPIEVSGYLFRLANSGSLYQQYAMKLLLNLCNEKDRFETDSNTMNSYCEEITNLVLGCPKDIQLLMLRESLSSEIMIPDEIILSISNEPEKYDQEVVAVAWKIQNM